MASYVKDAAQSRLSNLIFEEEKTSEGSQTSVERSIRKHVLSLVDRLAEIPGGLDLQVLVDVAIVYGEKNYVKIQKIIEKAASSDSAFGEDIKKQAIPAFTQLLQASDVGLNGLRKASFCLNAFLQCSSSDNLLLFALDNTIVSPTTHASSLSQS